MNIKTHMPHLCGVITTLIMICLGAVVTGCSDDTSYTDLLNKESKNVNTFLSDHRVIAEIPADTVFECGEDAPYYMLDDEGNVFMQVIDPGFGPKVVDNQIVYFRYMRYNLSGYVSGEEMEPDAGNDNAGYATVSLRYNNFTLPSSSSWGYGLQMPLRYLPLNSVVNIVIKAEFGMVDEQSYVQPFLYSVRYFPGKI